MKAVADTIAESDVYIAGLQEVTYLKVYPDPGNPEVFLEWDYLDLLLSSLQDDHGLQFAAIESDPSMDQNIPGYASLAWRNVLIYRSDLPTSEFKVFKPQTGCYEDMMYYEIPGFGTMSDPRCWVSVDVRMKGTKNFRVLSTHLESYNQPVRTAQAAELLYDPQSVLNKNGNQPTVFVGDFNSFTSDSTDDAIGMTLAEGYVDSWDATHPGVPEDEGYTWGHDPLLADPSNAFDRRIDYVVHTPGIVDQDVSVIDKSISSDGWMCGQYPLWASDHAAVIADLAIEPATDNSGTTASSLRGSTTPTRKKTVKNKKAAPKKKAAVNAKKGGGAGKRNRKRGKAVRGRKGNNKKRFRKGGRRLA